MTTKDIYSYYKCTSATPESLVHKGDITDPSEMMELLVNTFTSTTQVLSISFHQILPGRLACISIDRMSINGEWSTLAVFEKERDL